ncbi:hypothetical protein WJX72_009855 [[Myrmecia] bisecta]|uniref:VTT domain-containing protein n=1 Tax=[Myrmecia] bisecta TaxID=41462 RepID=A0AAW1QG45_9CHLO
MHKDQLRPLLVWTDAHRTQGAFAFVAVYILCTVLFVPGLLLSLGGGAIFGLLLGTLLVWIGACIGAILAFLLGRSLLRDYVAARVCQYPKWLAVEHAIQEEGWQIAVLLRLAPVVPFNALNYILGLTNLPLPQYAWSTAAGILPGTLMFVYFGSIASITSGEAGPSRTVAIASLVVSDQGPGESAVEQEQDTI